MMLKLQHVLPFEWRDLCLERAVILGCGKNVDYKTKRKFKYV